jgi:hypothetical protein
VIHTPQRTHQHSLHAKYKKYPARIILQMHWAANTSGLNNIEREWPLHGAWDSLYGGWHWFDVSGTTDAGERLVLDTEPGYRDSRPTQSELKRYRAKVDFCQRRGWTMVTIERGQSSQAIGVRLRNVIRSLRL